MSTSEAAAYLNVTPQAVRLLTKQGIGQRVGKQWAFTQAELDAWRDKPRPLGGRPPKSARRPLPEVTPA